ncbi:MAG: hypothetical protein ACLP2F_02940 [Steroidobacteraceae bacterium]
MSHAAANPAVLSRLYLSAVLPCLSDLAEQDGAAAEILGQARASIVFLILGGPAATIRLKGGHIAWDNGCGRGPSVILLFLNDRHLNAFFSGKKWAAPLPVWGGWRIGLLTRFSKLAARLEAVLDGAPQVLETAAGRRLHARLSLIAAGLALHPLAEGDAAAREILRSLPPGLASFTIDGEPRATVWFDHGSADNRVGWGDPPRRADVCIVFADIPTAYGALREEIDTLAAVGSGQIRVEGLVPLADGLNFAMERLRAYLKP